MFRVQYHGQDFENRMPSKEFQSKDDAIRYARTMLTDALSVGIIGEETQDGILYSFDKDFNATVFVIEV